MNQLITFDSSELLQAHKVDVSALPLDEQLKQIFELAKQTLAEDNLDMNSIIFTVAEMCDMRDRPILNEAQKLFWKPENYPARVILERQCFKAGARARLMFTATKAPHVCTNSMEDLARTGPFSRAALVGGRVYGCGVRPIDLETKELIESDFYGQTVQCLKNLDINMRFSGTSLEKAYSFIVYLTDLSNTGLVLDAFKEFGFNQSNAQLSFEAVDALNEYVPVEISCSAIL